MKANTGNVEEPQASAHDYALLFNTPHGEFVLNNLVARFCQSTYVRGGLEAQRETDYRAGRRDVIEFILGQINRDAGVSTDEGE